MKAKARFVARFSSSGAIRNNGRALAARAAAPGAGGSGVPSSGTYLTVLAVLAVSFLALALTAAPAQAVRFTHPHLETFGSAAQPSFDEPTSLAVDQSNGDLLVVNAGAGAVERFHADGSAANFSDLGTNVIDGAGGADETPQGGLSFPANFGFYEGVETQIAVDNSGTATNGDIYVTQYGPRAGGHGWVDIFSEAGDYIGQLTESSNGPFANICGVAVDPKGNVYVGDYYGKYVAPPGGYQGGEIHKYEPSSNRPLNGDNTFNLFSFEQCSLAAGAGPSAGYIFAASYYKAVTKIASEGPEEGETEYTVFPGANRDTTTVSVDPGSGHVFVAAGEEVLEFDASGASAAQQISTTSAGSTVEGIAVDEESEHVYLTRRGVSNVEVFGPFFAEPVAPTASTEAATEITLGSAVLHGSVNPSEENTTDCHFEWGPSEGDYSAGSAPCSPNPGSSPEAVPVSVEAAGLTPHATYHYRVVITTEAGTAEGADQTFVASPQPSATTGAASGVGDESVTLNATVNPKGGSDGECHLQWGPSAGNYTTGSASCQPDPGSATTDTQVSAEVTGLSPLTTYHFRVVEKTDGGTAEGADAAFTTSGPPTIPQMGASPVTDTSVRLFGFINPGQHPTTYHFEYGTEGPCSSHACTSVPVPDGRLAAESSPILVAEQLEGLEADTTYYFRLLADNSSSPSGGTASPGASFTTRSSVPAQGSRAYEMVTPPFKSTVSIGEPGGSLHRDMDIGTPSLSGEQFIWDDPIFPLNNEAAFPFIGDILEMHRTPEGWVTKSQLTQPPLPGRNPAYKEAAMFASSGNFAVQSWRSQLPLLENASPGESLLYTRRDGTGTNAFTNWLPNVDAESTAHGLAVPDSDYAQFNDDGSAMVRWGLYRGLLGSTAAQDPSVTQLAGGAGGSAAYVQEDPPTGAIELVAGCVGTRAGGDATQIPARVGTGLATDTIGTRGCQEGSVVSTRGAVAGGGHESTYNANPGSGTAATAMSDDGRRVYFESPDPAALRLSSGMEGCEAGVGTATECPPQLYLRDRSTANPVVSWISHSRSQPAGENGYGGPMIAGQQVGLIGQGVGFEGASRDGSIVYFRTDAPLTPDDPNGAGVAPPAGGVTTGEASTDSWDLYQYKLPASGDPGEGTLTRISGGPSGHDDPDTESAFEPGAATSRYISDNGKLDYFVTTSPIAGADNAPPQGGTTTPGGAVGNHTTRDLYLFDEEKSGAERYKFIAQLPTETSNNYSNAACATTADTNGPDLGVEGFNAESNAILQTHNKCFRGTPSGSAVIFETPAQLTADDHDEASDIYLYDARRDELTRISAPLPGASASSYGCREEQNAEKTVLFACNADLGFGSDAGPQYEGRGWNGGSHYNIAEEADGAVSVYFESRSQLVPQDTNSGPGTDNYWDVYEWREGKLSLVSPGDTDNDAYYSGNSLDGRDVFFGTTQRIDPRELGNADYDIYDARVGGGIPYTPPATPCDVLALKCEANASTAPATSPPASREFSGPGNVKARPPKPKCAKGKVRKHGKCVKKGHKHKKGHKPHHKRAARAKQGRGK